MGILGISGAPRLVASRPAPFSPGVPAPPLVLGLAPRGRATALPGFPLVAAGRDPLSRSLIGRLREALSICGWWPERQLRTGVGLVKQQLAVEAPSLVPQSSASPRPARAPAAFVWEAWRPVPPVGVLPKRRPSCWVRGQVASALSSGFRCLCLSPPFCRRLLQWCLVCCACPGPGLGCHQRSPDQGQGGSGGGVRGHIRTRFGSR